MRVNIYIKGVAKYLDQPSSAYESREYQRDGINNNKDKYLLCSLIMYYARRKLELLWAGQPDSQYIANTLQSLQCSLGWPLKHIAIFIGLAALPMQYIVGQPWEVHTQQS